MKALAIAHRGKHDGKYYENTLNAFIEAGKGSFYGIETDIHLSKDRRWIIHHNDEVVSNGKKYAIKDTNYDVLMKLHLDNDQNDEQAFCPRIEEYFEVCKNFKKRPIVEFKMTPKLKELKDLCSKIDNYIGLENVTFISFYPWPLIKLRWLFGRKVHLQNLIEEYVILKKWAKFRHMDIDIQYDKLTQRDVDTYHKKNLKVNVWTVDDKDVLERLEKMGVDYITTNVFDQNS